MKDIRPELVNGEWVCASGCPQRHCESSPSYCGVLVAAHDDPHVRSMVPTYPGASRCFPYYQRQVAGLEGNLELQQEIACALADDVKKLETEVEHLRECMRVAGLQCFMRDRDPQEVATHLRDVLDSYYGPLREIEDVMLFDVDTAPEPMIREVCKIVKEILGPYNERPQVGKA